MFVYIVITLAAIHLSDLRFFCYLVFFIYILSIHIARKAYKINIMQCYLTNFLVDESISRFNEQNKINNQVSDMAFE